MTSQHDKAKHWRPWQFSLRELVLLLLVVACAVAWWRERQKVLELSTIEARHDQNVQRHAFELGLEVVQRARGSSDSSHKQEAVEFAEQLLMISEGPPAYTSGRRRRPWTFQLMEEIAYLKLDIARERDLVKAVEEIAAAIQAGDHTSATEIRQELIQLYPDLAEHPDLAKATE